MGERKALAEVNRVRRELDLEKQGWQGEITSKLEAEFKVKEGRMAAELKQQRDQQITAIIEKLTVEHQAACDKAKADARAEWQGEREAMAAQVQAVEVMASRYATELAVAQTKLDEAEGRVGALRTQLKGLEVEFYSTREALQSAQNDVNKLRGELQQIKAEGLREHDQRLGEGGHFFKIDYF